LRALRQDAAGGVDNGAEGDRAIGSISDVETLSLDQPVTRVAGIACAFYRRFRQP
jgi:hypothetical protein